MLSISVIIAAYTETRWAELLAVVQGVQGQTRPPSEIIVVIDHNPRLYARAAEHLSGVVLIENAQARGLSGARNSGILAARGDVLAFIDDDALPAPDWLACLTPAFDEPNVIGAGGAIQPRWAGQRPAWFPAEFDWVVGCTYRGLPTQAAPVRNLIGCNMAIHRAAFAAVGPFKSGVGRVGTLPVGCEETELCIRVSQHMPHKIFQYQPEALVAHHVPAARMTPRYFFTRCFAEGISKAQISRMVGRRDGLAAERAYTFSTLPQGLLRGLQDALTRRDGAGLLRAGAIAGGLLVTAAGYALGWLLRKGVQHEQI